MKRVGLLLMVLWCAMMLGGCGGEEPAATDRHLTLGLMPDVESIPLVVAEMEGYFADEGVEVKLIHFKSAKDRDSALQGGELDGVVNDMVAVLFNNEGGIPLQVVARTNGRLALMGGKEAGVTALTAEQISGKTVGLSLNTVMEYTADQMLASAGLALEAGQKVAVPQIPTRLEMLQGGRLDMAIMCDPFVAMALRDGAALLMDTTDFEHTAGTISFNRAVMAEQPEAVKAVMRAYETACAELNAQGIAPWRDELITIMSFPEASRELLELPRYDSTVPTEATFDVIQAWMHDKALLKGEYAYNDIVVAWE